MANLNNVRQALEGFCVEETTSWLDTSFALHCIKNGGELKQFVVNQITKIKSKVNIQWRYVPTTSNPADVGSRGGNITTMSNHWLTGPEWLSKKKSWSDYIVIKPSLESEAESEGHYLVYLPDKHPFSIKLVEDARCSTLHGGVGLTMACASKNYWVPQLRQLVRKIIKCCQFRAKAIAQLPLGLLSRD